MKIIKIQFNNINNLKGAHSISFDQVPLSTAGIFAIVGPTGSGKSTILDVITLALFNRIPRFSKSISKNEITREGSVVTHHTTEASASIEYEIKGKRYKSAWSVETNRNGKLKDYEMTFYNSDGSIADLKKSEIPAQNEAVIGLKYDQFVKSILLSQGEFSKFLRADKNERGALLENLTGTAIYRKIGISTYERSKAAKEKLDREKELIGVITTLEEEERQQLEIQLKASKKEKTILDTSMASWAQLLQVKNDLKKLSSAQLSKQQEAEEIKSQALAFQPDEEKLSVHQKLSHVQGPLATYNDAVANARQSQENLQQYQTEFEAAKKKHQATIKAMADLTKQSVDEQSFKRIMNAFETEINNADRDIANLKKNGIETRNRINKQKGDYPIDLEDSIKPKAAISQLTERASQLQKLIAAAKLDVSQPLVDIKKVLKQEQEQLTQLKAIQLHYQKITELKTKAVAEENKLQKYTETNKIKTPLAEKCEKLILSTEKQITLLIKQKEDAIKIAELEDLRVGLVSGEACPLCGALDHPFAKHLPAAEENAINAQITETQLTLKDQQQELATLNKELSENLASIKHTKDLINETTLQQTEVEQLLAKETANLGSERAEVPIGKDNINQLIETKEQQCQKTEAAAEAVTEAKQNKDLIDQYLQLEEFGKAYVETKAKREEKFMAADVNLVTNKLQDDFEESKSKVAGLTIVIGKETESLKRDSSLVTSFAKELQPKIQQLGFMDIAELSSRLLDEPTFNLLSKQRDALSKSQTRIDTEIKNLAKELLEKQQLDTNAELTTEVLQVKIHESKALIEKHQNVYITNQERLKRDDEDRAKIKAKQEAITALNQELAKWSLLNKMIGDATGNKFANFAQGLTLQNLLVYANKRLNKLSDRYLLDKPENDGALIVIDKYQGNTSRSVKTLSGGESFLISLALALSLSDMASKNVALECLFIDEGFGTLDSDTLELAMTTLEKLQSESQKTVGVISHVAALKERIHVQIRLNKNAQGYSQIEIEG